jgi:uncharacterized protein (DUF2235 family)
VKRLIVCADGTWNEPTQTSPTNVVKIARAIATSDGLGNGQIIFYHQGLGTDGNIFDRINGGAVGQGIDKNIQNIYLFLASNFEDGDELWLFGFSRGAYTVRSVAGLIRNSGLLRHEHFELYKRAYELYRDPDAQAHPNSPAATEFRKQYATEPRIRFIGVWDTVGALGIPLQVARFWSKGKYEFHNVELSGRVDFAFQALAIDEKREPFVASVWGREDPSKTPDQVLEQAWFPGVHCDVGGGYAEAGLSDSALMWMIDGAKRAGLVFRSLEGFKPSSTDTLHDSMTFGYRLLGDGTRKLGTRNPGGNERLSPCAEERGQRLGYNPKNLGPLAGPAK